MTQTRLRTLILAALLAAFTTVATMIIKVPTPTFGYIHLGDGFVLLCGILLGPGLGAVAAGIGSMFADIFSGYASFALATLVIKALTALVAGLIYHKIHSAPLSMRTIVCGVPAECLMVFGYYLYEAGMMVVGGSAWSAALQASLVGAPFNVIQGIAGVIISLVILPVLSHAIKHPKIS